MSRRARGCAHRARRVRSRIPVRVRAFRLIDGGARPRADWARRHSRRRSEDRFERRPPDHRRSSSSGESWGKPSQLRSTPMARLPSRMDRCISRRPRPHRSRRGEGLLMDGRPGRCSGSEEHCSAGCASTSTTATRGPREWSEGQPTGTIQVGAGPRRWSLKGPSFWPAHKSPGQSARSEGVEPPTF